ncbi:MAG: type VI secretion system protein TssA [Thermoguttaceae bacterium]|jgi:type VI secretion system protein ImpA|nr:type VI secretion system protein TssA [Thermoguttaceae bacterium]
MATAPVLDFDKLLAPIPGDSPTGFDVREAVSHDSLYTLFRDTAAASRRAESEAGEIVDDLGQKKKPSPPEWGKVLDLGLRILTQQSKDMEVAILLTEPLVRKYGFAGLRDGFRLVRELVERYWDTLFPSLSSPEGLLDRVDPLGRLNETTSRGNLVTPILRIPITAGKTCGPYSLWDYRQAVATDAIEDPEKRAQRLEEGVPSLDQFTKAVGETPPEFFGGLLEDIEQCLDELGKLGEALEERCGPADAPPVGEIREALANCREKVQEYAGSPSAEGQPAGEGLGAAAAGEGAGPGIGLGPIRTREQAFQAILRIADFFRRTEPHSPVAYQLERAVRWGRMPLPELLQELIAEDMSRNQTFKLVGISVPEAKTE